MTECRNCEISLEREIARVFKHFDRFFKQITDKLRTS